MLFRSDYLGKDNEREGLLKKDNVSMSNIPISGEYLTFGEKDTGRGSAKISVEEQTYGLITTLTLLKPALQVGKDNFCIIPDIPLNQMVDFIALLDKMQIYSPENKLSAGKPVEVLPIPSQVVIPLGQHIGAPAIATVKKGDEVKVGIIIAQAGGFVSANIHSSVSGKILKINNVYDSSGYPKPTVFISVEGDEWEEGIDRSSAIVKECNLDAKEIVAKISAAGIVGLGGATFPTHVKLSPPPGNKAEILKIGRAHV